MTKYVLLTAIAMTGIAAFAQEGGMPGVTPVQMVVTVEAVHGKVIPELRREDVKVYEGKNRLHVAEWTPLQGERAGLELFILIDDASSSALGSQFTELRQFIADQPASTSIGIAYLHDGMAGIVQSLTPDHSKAAAALRLPFGAGAGGTSPYLGLCDLVQKWPSSAERREVVMISSGADPLGGFGPVNPYVDLAIEHAQIAGIIVYAIYTPPAGHAGHSFLELNSGQNYLARLAEETGGESHMLGFSPAVTFEPYLRDIAENLKHQYSVSFFTNRFDKPTLTPVRFSTEVPNAEIIAAPKVMVWPEDFSVGGER